jgi:hypothetical protein
VGGVLATGYQLKPGLLSGWSANERARAGGRCCGRMGYGVHETPVISSRQPHPPIGRLAKIPAERGELAGSAWGDPDRRKMHAAARHGGTVVSGSPCRLSSNHRWEGRRAPAIRGRFTMWITIEKGPDAGASAEITDKVFTIGRNPANKLVLTDPQASSRHASIEIAPDGSYLLRDLQSTNGTFIDGRRLDGAVPITGSERLQIGQTEMQLSPRTAGATVITPMADPTRLRATSLSPAAAAAPPAPPADAQPIAPAAAAPPAPPAYVQPGAPVAPLMAPPYASQRLPERDPVAGRLLLVGLLGAAVALTLGIYGSAHTPASDLAITLGFTNTITMKVWFATIAVAFALAQLLSALWIYGRLPLGAAPSWLGRGHRISGRLAFIISLPVAYHCLYQLGFQHTNARVLAHSVLGCAFYGAFASKIVVVRSSKLPGLALPVAGGVALTVLAGVWLTSGLWYISNFGFPSP